MPFSALRVGPMTLHLITEANLADVRLRFSGFADSDEMLAELDQNYRPQYDAQNRQIQYGFYALLDGQLAGLSLLSVDGWTERKGSTGADTLGHMRGKSVAPGSNRTAEAAAPVLPGV